MSSPNELTVRPVRWGDFDDLRETYFRLYDERAAGAPIGITLFADRPSLGDEADWFHHHYQLGLDGDEVFLVAERGGLVVGSCTIGRSVTTPGSEQAHVGELGILVRQNQRGTGVGTALLQRALAEARRKFAVVYLSVFSNNEGAQRLYRRFGFSVCGHLPRVVKRGDQYYDEERMILDFSKVSGAAGPAADDTLGSGDGTAGRTDGRSQPSEKGPTPLSARATIRPLRWEDFDDWQEMLLHMYDERAGGSPIWTTLRRSPPSHSELARAFHHGFRRKVDGDAVFLVAEVNGHAVGQCSIIRAAQGRRAEQSHVGELGLLVHEYERRKGIGSALLKAALADARSMFEVVLLSVWSKNEGAIRLYQRFGFSVCGHLPRIAERGGQFFDQERMVLDLSKSAAGTRANR